MVQWLGLRPSPLGPRFNPWLWNQDLVNCTEQPKEEVTTSKFPYLVRVTAGTLNVRAGAGTNYKVTTQVKKNQVYTIVDEKDGWGKLKSGAGWISLKYTEVHSVG